MIVLYENKKWELMMGIEVFNHLKKSSPNMSVYLTEHTVSNYKSYKMAKLRYIQDYSKTRIFRKLKK